MYFLCASDPAKLKAPDQVAQCQQQLKDALKYWFNKVRPDDLTIYDRCLDTLKSLDPLRDAAPFWQDTFDDPDGLDMPELILQMWGS